MRKQHPKKKRRGTPKTVLRLPDLDQAKSAVLNSLTSVDAQRGYRHAIDEFVEWCCSTERYLGCKQLIRNAVHDQLGIQPKCRAPSGF
jgi:hypothetical protein